MAAYPSLTNRIVIGKLVGFGVGLIGFITLPTFYPEATWMLRWGVLFWYVTVGAFIGMVGVYTRHPVLMMPMPWWFRAPVVGAWMNFVLTLFAFESFEGIMQAMVGADSAYNSPFWFVAEGTLVGALIGYIATRYAGEGHATVEEVV